jgi:cytoskeletal protein CcmA (bactofilin family)
MMDPDGAFVTDSHLRIDGGVIGAIRAGGF